MNAAVRDVEQLTHFGSDMDMLAGMAVQQQKFRPKESPWVGSSFSANFPCSNPLPDFLLLPRSRC
jgi:hypothetical protein